MFSENKKNRKKRQFGRRPSSYDRAVRAKRKSARSSSAARARKKDTRRHKTTSSLKPSELKERHTIRARKRFIIWVILWLLLIGSGIFALSSVARHEMVTIDSVSIKGTEKVSRDDMHSFVEEHLESERFQVVPRTNILGAPVAKIERALMNEFLRIKRVRITRENLNELSVQILEREPAFRVCPQDSEKTERSLVELPGDQCLLGDETGFLFAYAPNVWLSSEDVHAVSTDSSLRVGTTLLEQEAMSGIFRFIDNLETHDIQVEKVNITDSSVVRFMTDQEYDLLAETTSDFEETLLDFLTVLDSDVLQQELAEKEVYEIDMRFDNKVFYRFKERGGNE